MKYAILGSGRSATALAGLLRQNNIEVFISDLNEISVGSKEYFNSISAGFEENGHTDKVIECDVIALSPGIPDTIPIIELAKQKGIEITNEIELASKYFAGGTVAITGTNGKTTTTALVGFIFQTANYEALVAGNIGVAFSSVAQQASKNAVCALELSSFQLEHIKDFKPKIAAILNITPDHLDRYNSIDDYANAKFNITKNQGVGDYLILNYDDPMLRKFGESEKINKGVKVMFFSTKEKISCGAYLSLGGIKISYMGNEYDIVELEKMKILGEHNYSNAMAAAVAAYCWGTPIEAIKQGLENFNGVEHRLEPVRELAGVQYINDSKATNIDATEVALKSFSKPIVLIAGGKSKKNNYSSILELIKNKVKSVVLIGAASQEMREAFDGLTNIVEAGFDMTNAVKLAQNLATAGDIVLLSPACASFDMFNNFEHRGEEFKKIVNELVV